ncbi:hypothetical protein D3C81_2285930 [compost metagenome]
MTHRLEYPEIEIVSLVVALRIREITIVTDSRGFDGSLVFELFRFGEVGQATNGLHIFSPALAHEQ